MVNVHTSKEKVTDYFPIFDKCNFSRYEKF
jgi:hypothetical protein